jgi:hypothetical protein
MVVENVSTEMKKKQPFVLHSSKTVKRALRVTEDCAE